jgi:hypothetical protein
MPQSVPKVSIGLPVYNGERYLRGALDALMAQDFTDFELVISDNASTDGTAAICAEYARRDSRLRLYRNDTNIGSAPNYRRVFELARGEFFKWCSHDDLWHPTLLRRCLDVFASAPQDIVLVYARCELIDEYGHAIGVASDRVETTDPRPYRRFARVLRNVSYAYPIWGLIRADVLRRTNLTGVTPYWDETLLAELALFGAIREVPDVLTQQRTHQRNAVALCAVDQETRISNDPNRATRATRAALRLWTDPSQGRGRLWLPNQEEHYWEFAKRVRAAPLSARHKCLCYAAIPAVGYSNRVRKVVGAWRRRVFGPTGPFARGGTSAHE